MKHIVNNMIFFNTEFFLKSNKETDNKINQYKKVVIYTSEAIKYDENIIDSKYEITTKIR